MHGIIFKYRAFLFYKYFNQQNIMSDFKDIMYDRLRFTQNATPEHSVYVENGIVRQTNVVDGAIDDIYKFSYIYGDDGTPKRVLASSIISSNIYTADGTLTSNRVVDTGGKTLAIKGLTEQTTDLSNFRIMIQDGIGTMYVADSDNYINNVTVKTEW